MRSALLLAAGRTNQSFQSLCNTLEVFQLPDMVAVQYWFTEIILTIAFIYGSSDQPTTHILPSSHEFGTRLSELYPSCVDVENVWPPPNSILKPLYEHSTFAVYVIKVTFSRQIKLLSPNKTYISFSVSTVNPLNFRPYYTKYSCGSGRTIWTYFQVVNFMRYISKINILIDGGIVAHELSRRSLASHIRTGSMMIGEYYFKEYLERHPWLQPSQPFQFLSNPFCKPKRKRLHYKIRSSVSSAMVGDSAIIHPSGHQLDMDLKASAQLLVSTPSQATWNPSKYDVHLPPVINTTFSSYSTLVKLPNLTVTIHVAGGREYVYYVPASREFVYEINERLYHNQYKIVTPVKKPMYSTAIFSGSFPVVSDHSEKNITVKDRYTMKTLDYYYKVNQEWAHVSKAADVSSASAPKRMTQQFPPNSRICPTNSRRNRGRQGMLLNNAIEFGSFYHRLIPSSTNSWSQVILNRQMTCDAQVAESSRQLDLKPVYDGVNSPTYLRRALSKKFCIIPALPDIREPYSKRTIYKKFHSLQKCVFLSPALAESKECDGLQLFRNIQTALSKESFCHNHLGSCIGAPLSSESKFPHIFSYGLQSLSGYKICNSTCDGLENGFRYLGYVTFPGSREVRLMPRSSVVLTRKHGANTATSLHFVPAMPSREQLYLTIPNVTVLSPVFPTICSEISIAVAPLAGSSLLSQTLLLLLATIRNKGEGGANVGVTLKCSNLIKIFPSDATMTTWIEQESSLSLEFDLDVHLASQHKQRYHKCLLTMSAVHPLRKWDLTCPHYFITYYGRLNDPCNVYVQPPKLDMTFHAHPKMKSQNILPLHLFTESSIGRDYQFIRGITLTMDLPTSELSSIWMIQQVRIECVGKNIILLSEDELLNEADLASNHDSYELKHNTYTFDADFTKKRKLFFFSREQNESSVIGLCSVNVMGSQPNRVCATSTAVIHTTRIPLGLQDLNAILVQKNGVLQLLSTVYGQQTLKVMIFLGISAVSAIVFICITCGGMGCKLVRRKTVRYTHSKLHILDISLLLTILLAERFNTIMKDYSKAREQDQKYWTNPQVYIKSAADAAPHDPHFTLYNFKTNNLQPLSDDVDTISIMGELRYKEKKMFITFGRIKKVFIDRAENSNIWVVASSGVFLLDSKNVAQDYRNIHYEFLESINSST